mmetsp:Transcript_33122/g.104754  ORF Transcript_33122/g.104754 Transcript_33122/m.104754 type:complete len:475 (-) Transcript_33122:63-1487(-)
MIRRLQTVVKRSLLQSGSRFERRSFRIDCSVRLKEHYENKQQNADDIYHHEHFNKKPMQQDNGFEKTKEAEKFHDLPPRSIDQILSEAAGPNISADCKASVKENVKENVEDSSVKRPESQVENSLPQDESNKMSLKTFIQNLPPFAKMNKQEVQETSSEFFKDQYSRTTKAVGKVLRKKLQPAIEQAILYINDKSGWTEVEKLKHAITDLEVHLRKSQEEYRAARSDFDKTDQEHRRTQNEITALAVTKHAWTDAQFCRYQDLLAQERNLGISLHEFQRKIRNSEAAVESALRELMEGLRKRFHEEQLWTDRIRQLSMWSTIGILFANSIIFLMTYLLRTRERIIVQSNLTAIRSTLEGESGLRAEVNDLKTQISALLDQKTRIGGMLAVDPPPPSPPPPSPPLPSSSPPSSPPKLQQEHPIGSSGATASMALTVDCTAEGGREGARARMKRTMAAWYFGISLLSAWAIGRNMS